MKILISTGIYPPKTSGPAQYAYNMNRVWTRMGHKVTVKTYGIENYLPPGIRHLYFFFKIIPAVLSSDFIFTLDTFSVGLPTVLASKIFGKKVIIRTGGDFLWEAYTERTNDLVLLREFYKTRISNFSRKEKIIFNLTKWTLKNVSTLIFSTSWQKDIFFEPYELQKQKIEIVENHYDNKEKNVGEIIIPENRSFVAGARPLGWKNITFLKSIFEESEIKSSGATLDCETLPYKEFMEKIDNSYAVVLVSLGDISPHMILDAINLNKPFILTEENGLLNRVRDITLLVNPKNKEDVKEKILWLLNPESYKLQVEKIRNFSFVHTWEEIGEEILSLYYKI